MKKYIFGGGSEPAEGVLLGVRWGGIEQVPGIFIWASLDEEINNAINAGKKIVLNLLTEGVNTPTWVMNLPGVQLFSLIDTNQYHEIYCQEITMPVFWEPIFLEKKKNFIQVAGERYAANDSIAGIMVPFCHPIYGDWYVPHVVGYVCEKNLNQAQDLLDVGYTTEKMFNVGKETIDAWAIAFPNKALKLPIAPTHQDLDGNATNLAESIVNYAYSQYPDRFYAQINGLDIKTPYSNDPAIINASPGTLEYLFKIFLDHSPQIGFQMKAAATNGDIDNCRLNGGDFPCPPYDVLLEAVNIGLSYYPHFIEFWSVDGENPELQPILDYAKENLR